ncbi:MAG TPA: nucleotidyltransferase domain-containing protein [Byssovorax sp.]
MKAHDLLTAHQRDVGARVVAEESARREHVVVYLSGAHAYGFPSPDSDLDLKAIHAAPTREIVGLREHRPTFDRAEILDGVEIDYTSNEIGHALRGVLAGNGNFIERVLGATPLAASPLLEALRPLVTASLSRRVHRHYRGFATSQLAEAERKPTAKRVLYVLRTTLTGAHLLATAELVTDVNELLDARGLGAARQLVERKRAGEQTPLAGDELARWRGELARAFEALDAAERTSPLPVDPGGADDLEAWLVDVRRGRL